MGISNIGGAVAGAAAAGVVHPNVYLPVPLKSNRAVSGLVPDIPYLPMQQVHQKAKVDGYYESLPGMPAPGGTITQTFGTIGFFGPYDITNYKSTGYLLNPATMRYDPNPAYTNFQSTRYLNVGATHDPTYDVNYGGYVYGKPVKLNRLAYYPYPLASDGAKNTPTHVFLQVSLRGSSVTYATHRNMADWTTVGEYELDGLNPVMIDFPTMEITGWRLVQSRNTPDAVYWRVGAIFDYCMETSDTYRFDNSQYAYKSIPTDDNAIVDAWDVNMPAQAMAAYAYENIIRSVDLMLSRSGSYTGSCYVRIYSDNNGVPGSLLGTSSALAQSSITTKKTYRFDFATPVNVEKDTRYWVALYNPQSAAYKISWYCKLTGVDAANAASVYDGSAWIADATRNMSYWANGYFNEGYVETTVTLAADASYTAVKGSWLRAESGDGFKFTVKNADTGAVLYQDIADLSTISIDPASTPRITIRGTLTRNPQVSTLFPKFTSMGFLGNIAEKPQTIVDKSGKSNNLVTYVPAALDTAFLATSNGVTINKYAPQNIHARLDYPAMYRSYNVYYINSTYPRGQYEFHNPYRDTVIKGVGFKINSNAAYYTKLKCYIVSELAGAPNMANVLATASNFYEVATVDSAGGANFNFTFETPYKVPADTRVYFVVERDATSHASGSVSLWHIPKSQTYDYTPDMEYFKFNWYSSATNNPQANPNYDGASYFPVIKVMEANDYIKYDMVLRTPGVKKHGIIGLMPSAVVPECSIYMEIIDPTTSKVLCGCDGYQEVALSLFDGMINSALIIRVTMKLTDMTKTPPCVGLYYNYEGAPMAIEARPRKRLFRVSSYLGGLDNPIRVRGRGIIRGILAYLSTAGDSCNVIVDGKVLGKLAFATSLPYWCYNSDMDYWVSAATFIALAPLSGNCAIPFDEGFEVENLVQNSSNSSTIEFIVEMEE